MNPGNIGNTAGIHRERLFHRSGFFGARQTAIMAFPAGRAHDFADVVPFAAQITIAHPHICHLLS